MTNQTTYKATIAPLPYMPQKVSNMAMLAYIAALVTCAIVYNYYALEFRWILFGIIEVCGFFYFSNHCSKAWVNNTPKTFITKLFWWGFAIRILWVIISYLLYIHWTDTPFSIGAADELGYHEMAIHGADLLRDNVWNIYLPLQRYGGNVAFSDMGYPIYLSIVYWIFADSILIARIIKAIWSALTAVLIYKLALRNFGEYVGRMAGVFCMLMPNLIYYCSFQLKEVEMVFLAVLFAERADFILRKSKIQWKALLLLLLIPAYMFMIRTALAATLVLALLCALLFTSGRVVSIGRRIALSTLAVIAAIVMLFSTTSIGEDVAQMWQTGGSTQQGNMEWRSQREGKLSQNFAKYAGAAVFAPMIFTIPFPTMAETPGQENQKMIHGGNYIKNILSFFTITILCVLLLSGEWRKHVLPIALLCGYLVVLVFSNFAHSERFHQPILPFTLMMAAYGISRMREIRWIKSWYPYWCILMFVAAVAWNWFKLKGRGMI